MNNPAQNKLWVGLAQPFVTALVGMTVFWRTLAKMYVARKRARGALLSTCPRWWFGTYLGACIGDG